MKHFLVSWPGVVRVIRCVAHDLPDLPGVPTSFIQEFSQKWLYVTNSEKTRESPAVRSIFLKSTSPGLVSTFLRVGSPDLVYTQMDSRNGLSTPENPQFDISQAFFASELSILSPGLFGLKWAALGPFLA